jgi:hypothetical protein
MPLQDPLPEAPREAPPGALPGHRGHQSGAKPASPLEEVSPGPENGVEDGAEVSEDREAAVPDIPAARETPDGQETRASQDGLAADETPDGLDGLAAQETPAARETPASQEAAVSQEVPATRSSAPSAPSARPSSRKPGPPLLASQALIEDLAPVEPLGQHARILCVVAGLLFAFFGALPLLGVSAHQHPALVPSLVVGAVTLFAAVARVAYRKRAVAMVALGAIVAGLGVAGTGPAQGIAEGGAVWAMLRFVAAVALPAAILFRARYRAFEGARLLLGLAFVAALPYAFHAVGLVIAPAFGFAQVGAILVLVLLVAGLLGFMGSETTAAGSFVAPAMIAAFALQAGLQRLGALVPGSLVDVFGVVEVVSEDGEITHTLPAVGLTGAAIRDAAVTAVAFAASALLSALGLFQILAWKFAPAARKIDVRRSLEEVEERSSIEDWSTRH